MLLPNPVGPIPLGVPWWGALGGMTISFTGIFRNADRWQTRYELWHIARPFLGAVVGSVSYLIFIVAFVTGYREDIFRELLKRATDSLFVPAKRSQDKSDT
jgi:hypothetical protein